MPLLLKSIRLVLGWFLLDWNRSLLHAPNHPYRLLRGPHCFLQILLWTANPVRISRLSIFYLWTGSSFFFVLYLDLPYSKGCDHRSLVVCYLLLLLVSNQVLYRTSSISSFLIMTSNLSKMLSEHWSNKLLSSRTVCNTVSNKRQKVEHRWQRIKDYGV
jgi:hypothetical protein